MSRAQLLNSKIGLSASGVTRRIASGQLIPVHPGVYRLRGVPGSWHQQLLAACLSTTPNAVASHLSAGRLWELDGLDARSVGDMIEVTSVKNQPFVLKGVAIHRSRNLTKRDVTIRDRIPVTNLPRTLIDLAAVLEDDALERALESALRWRPHLPEWIEQRLSKVGGRGRSGAGRLKRLLGNRDLRSDRPDSDLEVRLRRLLKHAGLPQPEMHFDVLDENAVHVAELDFAYPHLQLGIQADGFAVHGGRKAFDSDRAKLSSLAALGWRMVHITDSQLRHQPAQVIRRIEQAMTLSAPTESLCSQNLLRAVGGK